MQCRLNLPRYAASSKPAKFWGEVTADSLATMLHDLLAPELGTVRQRQTLLAKLHCSRRQLLPDPEVDQAQRAAWRRELEHC